MSKQLHQNSTFLPNFTGNQNSNEINFLGSQQHNQPHTPYRPPHPFELQNPLRFQSPTEMMLNAMRNTPKIDINKMIQYIEEHAHLKSVGQCAKYVRQAIEAGGFDTTGRPYSAGDYGKFLTNTLFMKLLDKDNYTPTKGDIAVFEKNGSHPHGHIQIYTGTTWISDYKQSRYEPYSVDIPNDSIYRFPSWRVK